MNELYSEVREHLRQQHAMNTQEIHVKNVDNFHKCGYYGEGGIGSVQKEQTMKNNSIKGKVFLFLTCVMVFSCYLYGGQDVKKGAVMAWSDMNVQITRLEEKEPAVRQAMDYVRKAYHEVKDFTKTYLNIGE